MRQYNLERESRWGQYGSQVWIPNDGRYGPATRHRELSHVEICTSAVLFNCPATNDGLASQEGQ